MPLSVRLPSDDEVNWPTGGSTTIVGPDGRTWTFSSNANFHDLEIMKMALILIYTEDVADLVEPDVLAEQVRVITARMNESIRARAEAARRADLQQVPEQENNIKLNCPQCSDRAA